MIKAFNIPIAQNNEEKKEYRWQVAVSLLILFVSFSLANVAFLREVNRLKVEAGNIGNKLSIPLFDHLLSTGIYSLILGAVIIFIGLWVSSRANLGAPVLARLFSKKPVNKLINWKSFLSSIILAVVVAVVILGLFELQKSLYPVAALQERPSKLYYIHVSFVAGTTEEIVFRIGLMSLLVTAFQFLRKLEKPTNTLVWMGIILSSLVFGLVHFPITSNFFELTPFTIGVTMAGNLITGTTFGWIFWKRGLLVAIAAHIAFDLTFHVIGSPFG